MSKESKRIISECDIKAATEELFWSKIKFGEIDECWNWMGVRDKKENGYGVFHWFNYYGNGKWDSVRAHRLLYQIMFPEFKKELHVLHTCDNPPCVNPNHLWQGTHAENMADMGRKGRNKQHRSIGEKNPNAKLTIDEVILIRKLINERSLTLKRIGEMFNISNEHVAKIRDRQSWRHLI